MSDIEQRVKKIVSEQLGTDEASLKNESSFINFKKRIYCQGKK